MAHQTPEDAKEAVREKRANAAIRRFASRPAATAVMQVLVDAGGQDMGVSTICEAAGISRQAFYDSRDMLLELGLIEHTREENGGAMYRAPMASDQVTAWQQFRAALREAANAAG